MLREDSPLIANYDPRTVTGTDVSGWPVAKLPSDQETTCPLYRHCCREDEFTCTRSPEPRQAPRCTSEKSTSQTASKSTSSRSSRKRSPRRHSRSPMKSTQKRKSSQKKRRLSPRLKRTESRTSTSFTRNRMEIRQTFRC